MAPGDAYLVTTANGYDLWVIVGEDPLTYEWVNTGPLGVGTHVNVAGSAVTSWNADTKVDKVSTTGSHVRAYCVTPNGGQVMYPASSSSVSMSSEAIALRRPSGHIEVPNDPTDGKYAANKNYVDAAIAAAGGSGGGGLVMEEYYADGKYLDLPIDGHWKNAKMAMVDYTMYDYDDYANHITATFKPDNSYTQYVPSNDSRIRFYMDSYMDNRLGVMYDDPDIPSSYRYFKLSLILIYNP